MPDAKDRRTPLPALRIPRPARPITLLADNERRSARRIIGAAPFAAGDLDPRLAQRTGEFRLRRRLGEARRWRRRPADLGLRMTRGDPRGPPLRLPIAQLRALDRHAGVARSARPAGAAERADSLAVAAQCGNQGRRRLIP